MKSGLRLFLAVIIAGMFLVPPSLAAPGPDRTEGGSPAPGNEEDQGQAPVSEYEQVKAALLAGRDPTLAPRPRPAALPAMGEKDLELVPRTEPSGPSTGPRAGPDARAITVSWVSPPAVDQWNFEGVLALIGAQTQFNVTVENHGDEDASSINVAFKILDWFDNVLYSASATTGYIPATQNETTYFYWTPTFCTYFQINVNTTVPNDINTTNDNVTFWQLGNGAILGAALWANHGTPGGFSGDVGGNGKWHVTDTIENDLRPEYHSAPNAWYHGNDRTFPLNDQYPANQNVSMKNSPNFNFKYFGRGWYLKFNYWFHGRMPVTDMDDMFSQSWSEDGGATWDTPRVKMYGPPSAGNDAFPADAYADWLGWITDANGDGSVSASEFFMDISSLAGKTSVAFENRYVSDATIEDIGIYLDDFVVWGQEVFDNVEIEITSDLGDTKVGETETITAKVTNVGKFAQPSQFYCLLNVTKRGQPLTMVATGNQTVNALAPGQSQTLSFSWTPGEVGDYILVVNVTNALDHDSVNDDDFRFAHASGASPRVLVVDDNPIGTPFNSTDIIGNILTETGVDHGRYYNARFTGGDGPAATLMNAYESVIWCTGWDIKTWTDNGTLTSNDVSALTSYLNQGGTLWLSGMNVIDDLGASSNFVKNVLHVGSATTSSQVKGDNPPQDMKVGSIIPNPMLGVPGSAIGDGFVVPTSMPSPYNSSIDWCDLVVPDSSARGEFYQNGSSQDPVNGPFLALSYAGAYRVVFQTFDIRMMYDYNRTQYVPKVLSFLMGGLELSYAPGELTKSVDPGQSATFTLSLMNNGTKARTVQHMVITPVSPAPLPEGWKAEPSPLVENGDPVTQIAPQDYLDVVLTVTAPAKAVGETVVVVDLEVSFKEVPTKLSVRTTTKVNVILLHSISAQTTQGNVNNSGAVSYPFTVKNLGNMMVTAEFSKSGDYSDWISLTFNSVLLNPYEEKPLIAILTVPDNVFRLAGNYTLKDTITSRITYQGRSNNATLNLTTTIRVPQVFQAKIDDWEMTPADGQADMTAAKPQVKLTVRVTSANANGYDNATVEVKAKTFTPISGGSRTFDPALWTLPRTLVETSPFMTSNKEVTLTILVNPKAEAGEYSLDLKVTPGNGKSADGDITQVLIRVSKPDIEIRDGDLTFSPSEQQVGDKVTMKVNLRNGGNMIAKTFDVTFYDGQDNEIETVTVTNLAAGSTKLIQVQWTVAAEGDNTIKVKADPSDNLGELVEDNNEATGTVKGLLADLSIEGTPVFKVSGVTKTAVTEGASVQLEFVVKNLGTYKAESIQVMVTDTLTQETLPSQSITLEPKEERTLSFSWVTRKPGKHDFTISVNREETVREKSMTNNEASVQLKVNKKEEPAAALNLLLIGGVVGVVAIVAVVAALLLMRKPKGRRPAPSRPVEAVEAEVAEVAPEEAPAQK